MRIAIVMHEAEITSSALARLRYRRFVDAEPATFSLVPVERLDDGFDGYLFGKAFQPVVPALAADLASRGRPVVLDVCDDYVSEAIDVRVQRFVRWHKQMARVAHRVTTSTPALAARLASHAAAPPIVVPDPAPPIDAATLRAALATRALDRRRLDLAWFGIASNPYYDVGLNDVAAFADRLTTPGARHRLTVLTNLSGIRREAATALARAPIDVTVAAWSPEAERALLARVDAVVIPVADQPFSTAKSLNRAVTALAAGAQVISLGAPIYAGLAPFVYRSLGRLVDDVAAGTPRLRAERVDWLLHTLDTVAGARRSTATITAAFRSIVCPVRRPVLALVARTDELAPIAGWGGLLAASGFAPDTVGADVVLADPILLSKRARRRLAPDVRRKVRWGRLPLRALGLTLPPGPVGRQAFDLVRLRRAIPAQRALLERLFPDHDVVVADAGVLPAEALQP